MWLATAMSMQPATDSRFEFDKADRLRRALRVSGVGISEMSTELEVSRNTVSNWINGHAEPRPRDLRRFALKTGMPYKWLDTGEDGSEPTPGDDGTNDSEKITFVLFGSDESNVLRPNFGATPEPLAA